MKTLQYHCDKCDRDINIDKPDGYDRENLVVGCIKCFEEACFVGEGEKTTVNR